MVDSSVLSMSYEALALSLWRGPFCVTAEPGCGSAQTCKSQNDPQNKLTCLDFLKDMILSAMA